MAQKKSLYEILKLEADASYSEIRAAYEMRVQALDSRSQSLLTEDADLQRRLLTLAYSTLSTPLSRDAYDAHLADRKASTKPPSSALVAASLGNPSAAEIRADAMLMRADAMSLRADAMGFRADSLDRQSPAGSRIGASPVVSRVLSSFKTALLTLGTLAALGMVIKIVLLFTMTGQSDAVTSARSANSEKIFLQDYYQTWGVRPASRAEAELLDAQRRSDEDATRARKQAEDEKKKALRAEREFEAESRKRGAQVSAELDFAEEKARQARHYDEQQKERAERMKAQAERQRIEAKQAEWQRILDSPTNR